MKSRLDSLENGIALYLPPNRNLLEIKNEYSLSSLGKLIMNIQ